MAQQAGGRKNQWTLRYNNWYWVWGIKKKDEEKWTNFKGVVVHCQANQHMQSPIRKGERGRKNIWINNGWKCPNFNEIINLQIWKAQQTPTRMNSKRPKPRHIVTKWLKAKDKERMLNAAIEAIMQQDPQ